jgi:RND family efflux transporter MFP subunit
MSRFAKVALGLAVIGLGAAAAWYFVTHKPSVSRQKAAPKTTPVNVLAVLPSDVRANITAMGTVVPSREVTLQAEVSGQITHIAEQFTPGGRLPKGRTAVRIDPRDYEVQVTKARSALTRAEAELDLEQGKQEVARQELSMFEKDSELPVSETGLALRRPQLAQARAEVESARADLRQAELDLSRTEVSVPFNSLVTARSVNIGSQVGGQDDLATLAGTDTYWVRASVLMNQMRFIDLKAREGNPVRITSQSGTGEWTGHTLRLTGEVDEQTRMATLLIAVPDPLDQKAQGQPMMLNDYVRVEIQGRLLPDVFSLPRRALRENDAIWVMEDNRLDIRSTEVVWKDSANVYIRKGLAPGDKVVLSPLSTPVQGMRLQAAPSGDRS